MLVDIFSGLSDVKVDLSNNQLTSRSTDLLGKLIKLLNIEILYLNNNELSNNANADNDILQQITFDTTFNLQYFQLDESVAVDLSCYDSKISKYIKTFTPIAKQLYIKVFFILYPT